MTGATLEAEIDLHEAGAGAYYQFQLVRDPREYARKFSVRRPPSRVFGIVGPPGAGALPIGFLAGNTLQPSATSHASLDLSSAGVTLQPATAYHYRVLVARRAPTEDTIQWEAPTVQAPIDVHDPLRIAAGGFGGRATRMGLLSTPAAIQSPSSALSPHRPRHRHGTTGSTGERGTDLPNCRASDVAGARVGPIAGGGGGRPCQSRYTPC